MHTSIEVANWFIGKAQNESRPITQMKVQKLVYLAHVWFYVRNNSKTPLISDQFEAWEYGPVCRKLFDALRKYGRGKITSLIRYGDDTWVISDDGVDAVVEFSADEVVVFNFIWKYYNVLSVNQLFMIINNEGGPWRSTNNVKGRNFPISIEIIERTFIRSILGYARSEGDDIEYMIIQSTKLAKDAPVVFEFENKELEVVDIERYRFESVEEREKTKNLIQNRELRKEYARKAFDYLSFYSFFSFLLVVFSGIDGVGFELPELVQVTISGSTAVAAIGLVGIVVRGLFEGQNDKK